MRESLESEVRIHGGVPTLFINGEPETGLMHWNRYPTSADVEIFRNAGIHLYSFMGIPPIREKAEIPADYRDGLAAVPELTREFLDDTIGMLEKEDPECKVLIRFRITPPVWWREKHPESMIKSYDPNRKAFKISPHVSVCDPDWRLEIRKSLEELINYLEDRWGHRIFGYHPGMATCAENAHAWGNVLADFSMANLKAFRTWLQERYRTADRWNEAWHTTYSSFSEAEFPDPEIYFSKSLTDAVTLSNRADSQSAVDFLEFSSDMMADAVIFQSRTVKDVLRSLGREKICGAFYGYMVLPTETLSPVCSGHMCLSKVLACPDVDMLCAPIDYGSRQPGGVSLPQLPTGTAQLYGKLYYAEEDTRFHLAANRTECVSADFSVSENLLFRTFFSAWRSGGTLWWMDLFGEGWYRDQSFIKTISFCRAFAERHAMDRASVAQIAFFISEKAVSCERAVPQLIYGAMTEQQLMETAMCGAPIDLFRLEDLPELVRQNRLSQYRLAIVSAAHRIDSEIRICMEKYLKQDGRSVLWLYAPDICQPGGFSADAVSSITEIRLTDAPPTSLATESRLDGHRITYGLRQNISPRLVCSDHEAEILGWYVQGTLANNLKTGRNGGAFVRKKYDRWTSIWSASPGVPSEWIHALAREAGVHLYSDCGLQIFAAENWIAASAGLPGEYNISLPHPMTLIDPLTQCEVISDGTEFRITLNRGETRVWELHNKKGHLNIATLQSNR